VGTRTSRRLTRIKTYAGALMRDYRLTYEMSPLTSRSRLHSVATCDGGGVCLPATELTYTSEAPTWSPYNLTGTLHPGFRASDAALGGLHFGDFDGDGHEDVLYWVREGGRGRWWVRRGDGATFEGDAYPQEEIAGL